MSKQVEKIRSNISDALIRKDVNKVKQNIKALNYIVQTEKNIVLSDDDVEIYKSAWNQLGGLAWQPTPAFPHDHHRSLAPPSHQ